MRLLSWACFRSTNLIRIFAGKVPAIQLAQDILAHFKDPNGGFFDTRDDQEQLLLRPEGFAG